MIVFDPKTVRDRATYLEPNQTSVGMRAVLVNGKWLVSQQTFCTLVLLGASGKTIPGCSQ